MLPDPVGQMISEGISTRCCGRIQTPWSRSTPHVLRHSFASIANDLGFTESTVAALLGHAQGSVTSRYIHAVDTSLIMAADTVAGYIQALLEGAQFQRRGYALDPETPTPQQGRAP